MVVGKMNSYLVDCTEALDRANTAEQELGSLILGLRLLVSDIRKGTFRDSDPITEQETIADAIERELNGD